MRGAKDLRICVLTSVPRTDRDGNLPRQVLDLARRLGGLGKPQTGFPPPSKRIDRQARRARKLKLRDGLRRFTVNPRARRCGNTACDISGVGIRVADTPNGRRAGFSGLETCGSVWLCPVCAAKIAAQRAEELQYVLKNAQEAGHQIAMVTLTVRHDRTDSLKSVWDAVAAGWHRVTSGAPWKRLVARHGIAGWAKAVEVTHGANGWHVHVHAVIAHQSTQAQAMGTEIFDRWNAGIESVGFTAEAGPGVDVQVAGDDLGKLGLYLAKLGADLPGLAREATQGGQKHARGANRTPFQIAADLIENGDATDAAIWAEWTRTAPGHRALSWSKNFRKDFGLTTEEQDDETIAAAETGTDDDTILVLPSNTWKKLRHRSHFLLDYAENHGPTALKTWLTTNGYPWNHPPTNTSTHQHTHPPTHTSTCPAPTV